MHRLILNHRLRQLAGAICLAATAALTVVADDGPAVLPPPGAGGIAESIPIPAADEPLFEGPAASAAPADTAIAELVAEPVTPTPHWYQPGYWFGPIPWDAGIELGINGSKGNNETFSMRTGGHVKRVTPNWKLDSSLVYNKTSANTLETQNNGKLDWRFDRILGESPWTLFGLGNLIYDEFQTWDTQLSLNAGVGYQFVKSPLLDLTGRFGAGAVREFGGTNESWEPQALLGADYTHQLTPIQKLVAKVDYYPEWANFSHYRVVTDVGWQIDLDKPRNVSLKASVIDWYDSTPDGAEPNTLNYAVLLLWSL